MITLDKVKLADVLPESIGRDEGVASAAEAIDPQLKLMAGFVDIPALYVSIDQLPTEVLDHLASQYDVTVWRDTWPIAVKRSVLKASIPDKRTKGTVAAVKRALASVSSAAVIREWWQMSPKGTPHTFSIVATQSDLAETFDTEMQEDIVAIIDDAKPVRSHYTLTIQSNLLGGMNLSAFFRPVVVGQIYPAAAKTVTVDSSIGVVAAVRAVVKRHMMFQA